MELISMGDVYQRENGARIKLLRLTEPGAYEVELTRADGDTSRIILPYLKVKQWQEQDNERRLKVTPIKEAVAQVVARIPASNGTAHPPHLEPAVKADKDELAMLIAPKWKVKKLGDPHKPLPGVNDHFSFNGIDYVVLGSSGNWYILEDDSGKRQNVAADVLKEAYNSYTKGFAVPKAYNLATGPYTNKQGVSLTIVTPCPDGNYQVKLADGSIEILSEQAIKTLKPTKEAKVMTPEFISGGLDAMYKTVVTLVSNSAGNGVDPAQTRAHDDKVNEYARIGYRFQDLTIAQTPESGKLWITIATTLKRDGAMDLPNEKE